MSAGTIAAALLAGLVVGFLLGVLVRDRRRALVAENNHWLGEEIEALKGADLHSDVHTSREHAVIDPTRANLPPAVRATVIVAETLGRMKGRWRINGPKSAVPLAREAVAALFMQPEGRRTSREVLARAVPLHDQDAPAAGVRLG